MLSTKVVKVNSRNPQYEHLKAAADVIKKGGLAIIPTETVYGIAADYANQKANERLAEIKKRPKDKPFSLHIADKNRIDEFAAEIPVAAYKLMDKFWPGPLTLVLKAKDNAKGNIGIRLPDDEIAQKVITLSRTALACPSANISGRPAPVNFEEAISDLRGLVDYAIDAGPTRLQIESSIVDLVDGGLKVLREGAIKRQELESVARKKNIIFVCTGNSCRSVMAKAMLEKKLKEKGRDDVEVSSAGLMMISGLGASAETKEVLRQEGIDVSGHHSQRLTKEMLDKSDIILVMERVHEERILQSHPEAKGRLFLLREFARVADNKLDIPDPIGRSGDFYRTTFSSIKESIERIADLV